MVFWVGQFNGVIYIYPRCYGNEIWDKMGDNLAPLKENCTLFAPTTLFSGSRYPMVSFEFFPC